METHSKSDSNNNALIAAIVVVSLLIDALIFIYPLAQWAKLGIIWLVSLDMGLLTIALPQCFTT